MLRTFRSVKHIRQTKQLPRKRFSTCSENSNITATYNPLDKYLATNKHYLVFRKGSQFLHQFDAEAVYTKQWPYSQPRNWEKALDFDSNDELLDTFQSAINFSISSGVPLSHERYDQFIDAFISKLANFNTNELLAALQIFNKLPLSKTLMKERNYIELYTAFDQHSTIQCRQLTTDQAMFLLSIWFQFPFADKSWFAMCALNIFNNRVRSLTVPQLLQYIYYTNCLFAHIPSMDTVEKHLAQNIDNLSIEEMSIVAWTFMEQEASLLQWELPAKCLNIFIKNDLSQLDGVFLNKVLPVSDLHLAFNFLFVYWQLFYFYVYFQFIAKLAHRSRVAQLSSISTSFRDTIATRSLSECIQIANIGSKILLFDIEIVDHLLIRCRRNANNELNTISLANLEILSHILSSASALCDMTAIHAAGHEVLKEVKARLISVAYKRSHKSFLAIIRNLASIDVYDVELMDNLFQDRFLTFIYGKKQTLDYDLYCIDGYNRINLKHTYRGAVLSDTYLSKIRQMHLLTLNKTSTLERMQMTHIKKAVDRFFHHFYFGRVLPFYERAGTIFIVLLRLSTF